MPMDEKQASEVATKKRRAMVGLSVAVAVAELAGISLDRKVSIGGYSVNILHPSVVTYALLLAWFASAFSFVHWSIMAGGWRAVAEAFHWRFEELVKRRALSRSIPEDVKDLLRLSIERQLAEDKTGASGPRLSAAVVQRATDPQFRWASSAEIVRKDPPSANVEVSLFVVAEVRDELNNVQPLENRVATLIFEARECRWLQVRSWFSWKVIVFNPNFVTYLWPLAYPIAATLILYGHSFQLLKPSPAFEGGNPGVHRAIFVLWGA